LLELDPHLRVEYVDHADAAWWRLLTARHSGTETGPDLPDLVIVGVPRAGSDGCRFVCQVRQRFAPNPPLMMVLYRRVGSDHPRSTCESGAEFCLPKPNRYDEYKAILTVALASHRGVDAEQPTRGCQEVLCV
jgi:DNA-binding response OmpR family regulator